jgi:hypothetical protein
MKFNPTTDHREVHRCGDEAAWWTKTGIDPSAAARALRLEDTSPARDRLDEFKITRRT